MDLIRVDPEKLQWAAGEIERIAEGYRGLAQRALEVTQRAPNYDGQFGPRVSSTGLEAHARLNSLADQLAGLGAELVRIAEAFAAADADSIAAFRSLAQYTQQYVDAGLAGLFYSLIRPMHISDEVWHRLPLEDRIAFLQSYGLGFLVTANYEDGTVLYPRAPLRLRRDPGLNADILAYAPTGSAVTFTGITQTADGIEWYRVKYEVTEGVWVTGWMSSGWLSTGRSRVGYEPETVEENFIIHTDGDVRDGGGALMSVTSDWLQIRDGPTGDYAVQEAPQWGRAVRWTGRYIDIEGTGQRWYEVRHWLVTDDGTIEAATGWARADRVVGYSSPAGAPQPEDGMIWVQLQGERSLSYYTVTDVGAYAETRHDGIGFDTLQAVPWKYGGPEIQVPHGALFSAEGVAMQGSGKIPLENGETLYFELDNPRELHWVNGQGELTQWRHEAWSNGSPVRIGNPEDAVFRPVSKAPDLTSGISAAGPPSMRGQVVWLPELVGSDLNPDGLVVIEDAGGAFPEESRRLDIFIEDPDYGRRWYANSSDIRTGTPAYVQQETPPPIPEERDS